jgi:P27 family predicted phage terminase small subunit
VAGLRGRRAAPTALKLIRGTDKVNPGRINRDEPVPPIGDVICPTFLKGRARRFWQRHAPLLSAMRVLTTVDVDALAALCETEAEFWSARDDVRKRGIQIEVTRYSKDGAAYEVLEDNPSVKIASDAGKRLRMMLVEFGLTPSSRTRLKATKPEEKEDKWAGLLG